MEFPAFKFQRRSSYSSPKENFDTLQYAYCTLAVCHFGFQTRLCTTQSSIAFAGQGQPAEEPAYMEGPLNGSMQAILATQGWREHTSHTTVNGPVLSTKVFVQHVEGACAFAGCPKAAQKTLRRCARHAPHAISASA